MAGLLVELLLNALLLWWSGKKPLSPLGLLPTRRQLAAVAVGVLLAAGCAALYFLSMAIPEGSRWTVQPGARPASLGAATGWVLRSVLFEELIFRGALLYIAIQKLGARRAVLLSAAAFGIYHWFSYSAFGNPMLMLIIFVMTGIAGYLFADAFAVTRSLWVPVALHFGWNVVSTVVFSQGTLGPQWLVHSGEKRSGLPSLAAFLFQVAGLPLLMMAYLRSYRKQDATPAVPALEPGASPAVEPVTEAIRVPE